MLKEDEFAYRRDQNFSEMFFRLGLQKICTPADLAIAYDSNVMELQSSEKHKILGCVIPHLGLAWPNGQDNNPWDIQIQVDVY